MPPKQQAQRRITQSQNEGVYELGVAGRKTGLTMEERQRDEHGFEEVSGMFSSPEKDINNATANGMNGANGRGHAESDEEQTMEIDDESQMGPATMMKQRQSRPSLPRARSPIKTHLQSPARQNPHLGITSSPSRGSVLPAREPNPSKSVNRRLDFSQGSSQNRLKPPVNGHSKVNGVKGRNGKLTNGRTHTSDSDDDDDAILQGRRNQPREEEEEREEEPEESMQVIDAGADEVDYEEDQQDDSHEEPEPEVEVEEEPEPVQQPKRRGRKPKAPVVQEEERESSTAEEGPAQPEEVEDEPPRKRQRGRPAKNSSPREEADPPKKATKRRRSGRNSGSSANEEQEQEQEQEDNVEEERETKRQRSEKKEAKASASKPTATKEKGKPGRKRKSSGIGVDEPAVQRGPPLPKGRGLVALRREEDNTMRVTRSGRHSYRPLQFWKGEQVVLDESKQDIFEDKGRHFIMPSIKSVVRRVEETPPKKRRPGRPSKQKVKAGRRRSSTIVEEEEERDDWEFDPGRIVGECVFWRPDQEAQDEDGEVEVIEEELAISEAAIQLKDIRDATFKFAKTLTTPFFGSGIVDMPPGSEKRTKNSRKMQMVFFVHTGSVEVTVAQTEFRISKGGMWFVPRGNHYSITNNSDRPARIFFAQGCEMVALPEGQEDVQE
ncbi:Mif2/CENP-C like-domain-containing protein [Hypoxylon sp. FL0543]|nr:Mif2/CENP-C like-domain-containing protein [Hypoxylon sp. FL0543]